MPKANLILLAMEQSSTLDLLDKALRAGGYDVAVAKSPESLDKALQETTPSLLLITEKLGNRNGQELAKTILERFPTLPIILYAIQNDPALVLNAMRIGISDYIYPPLKIDDIVRAIQHSQKRAQATGDWVRHEVRRTTASLEQRVSELDALLSLTRSIAVSLDLDSVLTNVVSAAVELTRAEEGQLLLIDKETNDLYMRAGKNYDEDFARTFRLPVKDTLAGRAIETGQVVSLNQDSPNKIKTAYLVYSLIYVPLRTNERIIGVLGVDNRRNKLPFSKHHELLMKVLADFAAIAIQNAQLYTTVEQERSKYETIITNIQDGVILLNDEKCIMLINPAALKAFGLGLTDLTGKPVYEAILNNDFLILLDSISENPLKSHEITFEDGRVFNAQYAPIPSIGSVITLQDITHLKMLDRLKSDFIHTISHDLRSPLTAVMGYVELLERVGPLNDQQREFVKHIQNSAQNITSLVNDLLDLGRIEAGFDTRKDEVSLETILRYTLENLGHQINDKRQDMQVNIAPNLPILRGNPIRLRQLMDNLLVNAVKYTAVGGKIVVNLRNEADQIIFEVADSGVGIPAADQAHIFEKFYRASNAPKGTPGTGLGLAIVKSIVENHEGRIWVESTVDKGTKFIVVLPTFKDATD